MGPTVSAMMKAYLSNHKMMDVNMLANFAEFAHMKLNASGIPLYANEDADYKSFCYMEKLLQKANESFF